MITPTISLLTSKSTKKCLRWKIKCNIYKLLCLFLPVFFLSGCISVSPNAVSTIVSSEYDQKNDVTEYSVFPYGSVSLPGKWEKSVYNKTSRQQFFENQDSVLVAIAFGRFDNIEFNTDGTKKGYEFVKAYYNWESKYFEETFGLQTIVIEENQKENYLLYRFFGSYDGTNIDTYYLLRETNGNVSNFSVNGTNKWTEKEKISFLKSLVK